MKIEVRKGGGRSVDGRFFRDICEMIEAIARSGGTLLELVSSDAGGRRYVGDPSAGARLAPLAGLHRAQFVPEGSPSGRIVTEKLSLVVGEAESTAFIRTYNYVSQRVTDHQSGVTMSLSDALAGRSSRPSPDAA